MNESQELLRRRLEELAKEFSQTIEQAGKMARQAAEDFGSWVPPNFAARKGNGPADAIRELGKLRDEGLITEEEFQAKKAELLSKI